MLQPASLFRNGRRAVRRQPLLFLFLIVILTECLLFQWAAFVPMPADAMDMPARYWALEGFTRPDGPDAAGGRDRVLTAGAAGRQAVIIRLAQADVRTLHLDAYTDRPGPLTCRVSSITDQSGTSRDLGTAEIASGIARSRSLLIWPAGKVILLRLEFELDPGQRLFLNRIVLNRRIPFSPDPLRILLILATGILLHMLFKAPVFRRPSHPDDTSQRLIIAAAGSLIVILGLWLAIFSASGPFFAVSQTDGDLYSKHLTDALLKGRFDLLTDPPHALARLTDPYDPAQRITIPAESLLQDAAYYKGRYFVPYGVVPAVLLFAPFRSLSGYYFQTAWAVGLFGAFGLLLLFLVLRRLFLVHFADVAFRWHFLAILSACAASFAAWGLARPTYEEVASLGGFFFLMLAASQMLPAVHGRRGTPRRSLVRQAVQAAQPDTAWMGTGGDRLSAASAKGLAAAPVERLAAVPEESGTGSSQSGLDRISGIRLSLTSLFLMLAIGCQPILALVLIPYAGALILLLRRARRSGQVLETLFFSALPLLTVGVLLGAYNKARFGSMFEFGSQYRLTPDGLRAGLDASRLLSGLGRLLLLPPVINSKFPLVHFPRGPVALTGMADAAMTRAVGLLTLPFLAALPLLPLLSRWRRAFRAAARSLQFALAACAATGIALAAYSSLAPGASMRNAIEYGVWLALAGALAWLVLAQTVDNPDKSDSIHSFHPSYPQNGEKIGQKNPGTAAWKSQRQEKRRPSQDAWFGLFTVAAMLTLMICALLFLQGESDRIRTYSPEIYEQLRRSIGFWLP